jgi:hypothetical protein
MRVVQKPQFLNNFPGKKREFAALYGKFSGTWERTAKFLNKSIPQQQLPRQTRTAVFFQNLGASPPAAGPGFPLHGRGFAYATPVGFPLQSLARPRG